MGSRLLCVLLLFLGATGYVSLPSSSAEPAAQDRWAKRWVYVSSNLYVNENLPKLEELFARAKKAGYTGILFTDYKTATWWTLEGAARWKANAQKIRQKTKELGLELYVCVFPFGYAGGLLSHDVNLANGMPIKDEPLVAKNGVLVPENTAKIRNGSFEDSKNDVASGWNFQDDPGKGSFIDTKSFKDGKASLRFEEVGKANPHGHGRIQQQVEVRPWTQYRLRVWMKAERFNAGEVRVLVLAGKRTLQWQHLVAAEVGQGGKTRSLENAHDLTTDWVEQRVAFNSLDQTKVSVYLGAWGGQTGKIWWDDLRIDEAPTLNLLRRESLPLKIEGEDGNAYEEGKDFERIADERMGRDPWPGSYETRHEPPALKLTANSRIAPGQKVRFSGYHATLVLKEQVNCSLAEEKIYELCALQAKKAVEALAPDGLFMSHDEIRCAGWEPLETQKFKTSGELFAWNIKRCGEIARAEGAGKPVFVWSDMYDPNHNAKENYYLVNTTLAGSWEGLDKDVTVMKWGGGKSAAPGLKFFAERGHRQMIAAYYDGDPQKDCASWQQAAVGVPNLVGVMYTTWKNDYRNLEKFAELWWGGGK